MDPPPNSWSNAQPLRGHSGLWGTWPEHAGQTRGAADTDSCVWTAAGCGCTSAAEPVAAPPTTGESRQRKTQVLCPENNGFVPNSSFSSTQPRCIHILKIVLADRVNAASGWPGAAVGV